MPVEAIEVARFLISLAKAEEEEDHLSPLRLQKLVYYCHGWSWAFRRKPLIKERFEAWQYGPVVPSLYHEFKSFGFGSIDPSHAGSATKLSADERKLIHAVWEAYKRYSAVSLSEMTHRESPWIEAFSRAAKVGGDRKISEPRIRAFFTALADGWAEARSLQKSPGQTGNRAANKGYSPARRHRHSSCDLIHAFQSWRVALLEPVHSG